MDKEQFSINGHLHRWDGTRWTHDREVCCKPEEPKPENPNEWTHKCSYLAHVDGKVTLTDRSLNCFLCGALGPGDAVKVEPWWVHEPTDTGIGIWGHKHGRQTIIMGEGLGLCVTCAAERPHTDYDLKTEDEREPIRDLTELWGQMVHQIGDQNS